MEENQVSESTESEATEEVTTEEVSDRPEWLPEKFNSPEDMAKSYTALSTKLGEKEDDVRDRLMEELNAEASEGVPSSAGEYELPDIIDHEEAIESDLLKEWAEHCHSNGYTHDEFKKGIEMYMSTLPEEVGIEEEAKRLGENADARIDAVNLFANDFFPEEALPAIERMMEISEGVIAIETIMEHLKSPSVIDQSSIASNFNEVELEEMQRDERYWNPAKRDNNFVNQVNEGYKKLYG
tara:strand:+ start:2877 stop:3593 length:717 start_codon:yes stop_codon:yes gene_type:complete